MKVEMTIRPQCLEHHSCSGSVGHLSFLADLPGSVQGPAVHWGGRGLRRGWRQPLGWGQLGPVFLVS